MADTVGCKGSTIDCSRPSDESEMARGVRDALVKRDGSFALVTREFTQQQ